MRKTNLDTKALLYIAVLLVVTACGQLGGTDLPFSPPTIPDKASVLPDSSRGGNVKALCYIDANQYNPLNAGAYTLADGTQFFDYVVVGAALVRHDDKGWNLELPSYLTKALEKRESIIVPLQRKGIKVLLGITGGGDGISYESLTDDDILYFSLMIKDVLGNYKLDGAEFYDKNAGKAGVPFYPNEVTYDEPSKEGEAWLKGGDFMNNLIYRLRARFEGDIDKFLMLREENYGRWFPHDVSGSEGEATFSGTAEQINFFINPLFDTFASESANNYDVPFVPHFQYAPLAVNLGGDSGTGTVIPPVEAVGVDIASFSAKFAAAAEAGDYYGLLYYHNLKAISEAAAETYLVRPSTGKKITQAEYISITTQAVFRQDVVCKDGDYRKTW